MPQQPPFNPASLAGALTEDRYPLGLARTPFKIAREERVQWLHKKFHDDEACQTLADKLEGCKSNARCRSAACPECARAAQNVVVYATKKFLKLHGHAEKIVCVTIVPADGWIEFGQLGAGSSTRRWRASLAASGVGWFVGGIDYSFNEHSQNRYSPHWSKHVFGFAETDNAEALKRQLQRYFHSTDVVPRPVKIVPWDGDEAAIRYALKFDFERRIGSDKGERHDPKSSNKRSCRDTDHQPLRSEQKRELLVHLDQIGIPGRFMLRWAQFMNLGARGPTFVMRRPSTP